jgi:hypothetical protein
MAETMACLGDYWRQAGDPVKALAAYEKGQEHSKAAGLDGQALRQGRVLALAAAGRVQEAATAGRADAEEAEPSVNEKAPSDPSRIWCVRSWLTLAEVLPEGAESCDALRHAQAAWDGLPPANKTGFAGDHERKVKREVACRQ